METTLETIILRNLIGNDGFMRKVIPHLEKDYFSGSHQILFKQACKYVAKYNALPSKEQFIIELQEAENITDQQFDDAAPLLEPLFTHEPVDEDWLLDRTEKWCQDRAVFLAVMKSIEIIDGKDTKLTKGAIPEILQQALSVSFDTNVGHDYLDNFKERFDFYHNDEERIPFDIELLNTITKGGLARKTLTVILAGTGVGKSLGMCHMAAGALCQGLNVLYITAEMAEERIAERIDANLLDMPISDIAELDWDSYAGRISSLKKKSAGKMIIKEYPTGQANANHFRALLHELELKKNFKPDIVFIDYLNICASSRLKMGANVNSYTFIKSIAEEFRGLAIEFKLPIVTATQTNRTGYTSSDPGLEDTSESFGLPATADLMFAMVTSEELEDMGKIMFKQLKNRYNDPNYYRRFVVGIDRSRMKLYDVEQGDVMGDRPAFDNTGTGERIANTEKFEGFVIE